MVDNLFIYFFYTVSWHTILPRVDAFVQAKLDSSADTLLTRVRDPCPIK